MRKLKNGWYDVGPGVIMRVHNGYACLAGFGWNGELARVV